jgi:hypothetical protein
MQIFSLLLIFTVSHGFGLSKYTQRPQTALFRSISEQDALYLLAKAQECAFSDSATIEEAKHHLSEVLHIQSGCVVGTIAGRDLCDNQEQVAEIVVHLQAKIDQQRKSKPSMI